MVLSRSPELGFWSSWKVVATHGPMTTIYTTMKETSVNSQLDSVRKYSQNRTGAKKKERNEYNKNWRKTQIASETDEQREKRLEKQCESDADEWAAIVVERREEVWEKRRKKSMPQEGSKESSQSQIDSYEIH